MAGVAGGEVVGLGNEAGEAAYQEETLLGVEVALVELDVEAFVRFTFGGEEFAVPAAPLLEQRQTEGVPERVPRRGIDEAGGEIAEDEKGATEFGDLMALREDLLEDGPGGCDGVGLEALDFGPIEGLKVTERTRRRQVGSE